MCVPSEPDRAVARAPGLGDDLGLVWAAEDLAIRRLVPEFGIEALHVTFLPGVGRAR